MDYLALRDDAFPYPKADLRRELDCSGILKFNAYAVSYVPSGGSDHGFAEGLNSTVINEEGERLKISYRDRTFRFRSENGNVVQAIYQQLMARMTDERSILAGRSRVGNP
jgi:hypothetical protein